MGGLALPASLSLVIRVSAPVLRGPSSPHLSRVGAGGQRRCHITTALFSNSYNSNSISSHHTFPPSASSNSSNGGNNNNSPSEEAEENKGGIGV